MNAKDKRELFIQYYQTILNATIDHDDLRLPLSTDEETARRIAKMAESCVAATLEKIDEIID